MRFFCLLLPLLLLLTACGPSYSYRETKEIPSAGWAYADSLRYTFTVEDSLQLYDLHLLLDHSPDFPYQNFYVRIATVFPEGERTSEQLSLQLAETTGYWLGECGGSSCTLDIPLQQGAYFSQPGSYEVVIGQYSRRDTLPGVYSVTLALEERDERRPD